MGSIGIEPMAYRLRRSFSLIRQLYFKLGSIGIEPMAFRV